MYLTLIAGSVYAEKRDGIISVYMVKTAVPREVGYRVLKLSEKVLDMELIKMQFRTQNEGIALLQESEENCDPRIEDEISFSCD